MNTIDRMEKLENWLNGRDWFVELHNNQNRAQLNKLQLDILNVYERQLSAMLTEIAYHEEESTMTGRERQMMRTEKKRITAELKNVLAEIDALM